MRDITPEGIKRQIEEGIQKGTTGRYMKAVPLNELLEDLEEYVKDAPKIGLLTEEEKAWKKHVLGNFVVDNLGEEIYQLPGGGLCGKGVWKMFEEALRKEGFNFPDSYKK